MKISSHVYSTSDKSEIPNYSLLHNKNINLFVFSHSLSNSTWEDASEKLNQKIEKEILHLRNFIDDYNNDPTPKGLDSIKDLLYNSISKSNTIFIEESSEDPLNKMGTKLCLDLLLVLKGYVLFAHVGISDGLLIRDKTPIQIFNNFPPSSTKSTRFIQIDSAAYQKEMARFLKSEKIKLIGETNPSIKIQPIPITDKDSIFIFNGPYFKDSASELTSNYKNFIDFVKNVKQTSINNSTATANILQINIDSLGIVKNQSTFKSTLHTELNTLKKLPIFKKLKDIESDLYKVHGITKKKLLKKGTILFHEGEESNELYIILSGSMDVFNRGQYVYKVLAGEVFGEIGVFNDEPRSFEVKANSEVELLAIEKETLMSLLDSDKSLGLKIYSGLAYELSHKFKNTVIRTKKPRIG